jgi:hypothetical protein
MPAAVAGGGYLYSYNSLNTKEEAVSPGPTWKQPTSQLRIVAAKQDS